MFLVLVSIEESKYCSCAFYSSENNAELENTGPEGREFSVDLFSDRIGWMPAYNSERKSNLDLLEKNNCCYM
jgi:hypothetical protein